MSSGTLRHWVPRVTKNASPATVLALSRRTSPSLGSTQASGASWKRQSETTPLQIRCFHPSPARKLYVSTEAVVATCLGLAGCGVLLARFMSKHFRVIIARVPFIGPKSLVPPFTWIEASDKKTLVEVKSIVAAGFEMASKRPTRLRDQAYREASFLVPHEIARLTPDAPQYRVQEMAPLSIGKEWQEETKGGELLRSPFNIESEARVFLYFSKSSDKATAAFLAINAELVPPFNQKGPRIQEPTKERIRLMLTARTIWKCQYTRWVRRHPDIIRRIGPIELPLIISFRGMAWGSLWDTRAEEFVDLGPAKMMANFNRKDS